MKNPRLTQKINIQNVNTVRQGIAQKINYNCPYYPTIDEVTAVITDQDTFPYPRYYRGEYNAYSPIVFEREAGFRTRNDNCYRMNCKKLKPNKVNYCWQVACSTTLPCVPKDQITFADKAEIDLIQQKGCITTYR
jgi:hypothetical protein